MVLLFGALPPNGPLWCGRSLRSSGLRAMLYDTQRHDRRARFLPKALRQLKRKGELEDTVEHRTSKYLNNMIETDLRLNG